VHSSFAAPLFYLFWYARWTPYVIKKTWNPASRGQDSNPAKQRRDFGCASTCGLGPNPAKPLNKKGECTVYLQLSYFIRFWYARWTPYVIKKTWNPASRGQDSNLRPTDSKFESLSFLTSSFLYIILVSLGIQFPCFFLFLLILADFGNFSHTNSHTKLGRIWNILTKLDDITAFEPTSELGIHSETVEKVQFWHFHKFCL
jgi:hypothetical protein